MKTGVYRYENKEYEWYYIEESDISKLKAFCYGFVRGEDLSRFATKLEKKTCSAVTMQGNSAFRIREMRMSVEKACIFVFCHICQKKVPAWASLVKVWKDLPE